MNEQLDLIIHKIDVDNYENYLQYLHKYSIDNNVKLDWFYIEEHVQQKEENEQLRRIQLTKPATTTDDIDIQLNDNGCSFITIPILSDRHD